MAKLGDLFWSERNLLATESVGFPDLYLLDRPGGIIGELRRNSRRNLRFFAFEPDVAATLRCLPFEDDVALDADFEAGADFEGYGGEESSSRDGLGIDG